MEIIMKRNSFISTVLLISALIVGCSNFSTNTPVEEILLSEQVAEFKVITDDFSTLDTIDEPSDSADFKEKRIARLEKHLRHLKRLLERIKKYEHKHPNDEAALIIRKANRLLNAAITAFKEKQYRKALQFAHRSRKLLKNAIKTLRPKKSKDG